MSIFGLPRHRLYWTSANRESKVADSMSRNRWEDIKKNLQFNDNAHLPQNRKNPDREKLFKFRPTITHMKQKHQTSHPKCYASTNKSYSIKESLL